MTYYVSSGTLNPAHSLTHLLRQGGYVIIWVCPFVCLSVCPWTSMITMRKVFERVPRNRTALRTTLMGSTC